MDEMRAQIDMLDEQLLGLLAQRMQCCHALGRMKRAQDLPIIHEPREAQLRARWQKIAARYGVSGALARQILHAILHESTRIQQLP